MTTPATIQEPALIECYSRSQKTWHGNWHPNKPGITFYPDVAYLLHPACFTAERFMLAKEWKQDKARREADEARKAEARIFREPQAAPKEIAAAGQAGGLVRTFSPPAEAAPSAPAKPEPQMRELPPPTPRAASSSSTPDEPAAAGTESETDAPSAPKKARGGKPKREAGSPAPTEA